MKKNSPQRHKGTQSKEEQESICRRCGRCCYAKLIIDGQVIYTPFPCPYLDERSRLCTVYENRFEVNPDCLTIEEGIRLGAFPADCPYVKDLPDYVPPREKMTEQELQLWLDHQEKKRLAGDGACRNSGR